MDEYEKILNDLNINKKELREFIIQQLNTFPMSKPVVLSEIQSGRIKINVKDGVARVWRKYLGEA